MIGKGGGTWRIVRWIGGDWEKGRWLSECSGREWGKGLQLCVAGAGERERDDGGIEK